jgi:hypothetical protein
VITEQTFAQCNVIDDTFMQQPIDGILGLAFQANAVDDVVPPLQNAIDQGLLDKPIFTVFLDTEGDYVNSSGGGVFTFGGLDTVNCGPVLGYVDLTYDDLWWFTVDSVRMGNAYKKSKASYAISDTGTTLVYGPPKAVNAIAKSAGAKWSKDYELYLIACNATYPPLTFVISGLQFNITSAVLNMEVGLNDGTCLFALIPEDMSDWGLDWLLGDPFIRQFCQIYDIGQSRLGFANPLNAVGQANSGKSNAVSTNPLKESFDTAELKKDGKSILSSVPNLEEILGKFH